MPFVHDEYYMKLARLASKDSNCAKKQLGCFLLLTQSNRGVIGVSGCNNVPNTLVPCRTCRKQKGGWDGHKDCRAVHAERAVLLHCARKGYSAMGAVLYSAMGVPCKDCMLELITAGIKGIVVERETYYDELSKEILSDWVKAGGEFRVFPPPVPPAEPAGDCAEGRDC